MPIVSKDTLKTYFEDGKLPLESHYVDLIDSMSLGNAMNAYQTLLGLRGFWPMSSIDGSGNVVDQSSVGLTLTRTGNPYYWYDNEAPAIYLDGSGDYLIRAVGAPTSITGTEAYIYSPQRGLTFGGWFKPSVTTGLWRGLISKYQEWGTGHRSYLLALGEGGTFHCYISSNGTSTVSVTGSAAAVNTWQFVVGRYMPSTSLAIFVNRQLATQYSGIPTSLYASEADFIIGGYTGGSPGYVLPFHGSASLCFLCAAALSDDTIYSLYEMTWRFFINSGTT